MGLFHRSIVAQQSTNSIVYLCDNDNQRISNPMVLKEMDVQYYVKLLGTSNNMVSPYSVEVIKIIHLFRCSDVMAMLLSSIPSDEEIRKTIFALPKSKAPKSDGFSMEFFTSS